MSEVINIGRRFPVKSYIRNLTSDKCPICGANKIVILETITREADDTLWISWEEICENPNCKYDKIYMAQFFPYYEGLKREWLG